MRLSVIVNNNLFWLVLIAAVSGIFLPQLSFLSDFVSGILFVMILGLGLTLPVKRFIETGKKPWKVIFAVIIQFTFIPIFAILLTFFLVKEEWVIGTIIVSAAPAEITSALMVHLAGGSLALGTMIMGISILVSPFVMPLIITLATNNVVTVNSIDIFVRLLLIVVAPLVIGSVLRSRLSRLRNYKEDFTALSGLMVVLLILIVASSNSSRLLDISIISLFFILLLLNFFSYLLGYISARLLRIEDYKSYVFTIGMKEFGIATAIALEFFGNEFALPSALYGIIILITSPILAKFLNR